MKQMFASFAIACLCACASAPPPPPPQSVAYKEPPPPPPPPPQFDTDGCPTMDNSAGETFDEKVKEIVDDQDSDWIRQLSRAVTKSGMEPECWLPWVYKIMDQKLNSSDRNTMVYAYLMSVAKNVDELLAFMKIIDPGLPAATDLRTKFSVLSTRYNNHTVAFILHKHGATQEEIGRTMSQNGVNYFKALYAVFERELLPGDYKHSSAYGSEFWKFTKGYGASDADVFRFVYDSIPSQKGWWDIAWNIFKKQYPKMSIDSYADLLQAKLVKEYEVSRALVKTSAFSKTDVRKAMHKRTGSDTAFIDGLIKAYVAYNMFRDYMQTFSSKERPDSRKTAEYFGVRTARVIGSSREDFHKNAKKFPMDMLIPFASGFVNGDFARGLKHLSYTLSSEDNAFEAMRKHRFANMSTQKLENLWVEHNIGDGSGAMSHGRDKN